MDGANGVLLVAKDPETVRAVTSALGSGKRPTLAKVCGDLPELTAQLEQSPAGIVVVDIDPAPRRALVELGPIVGRFSDTRFVVLSRELQSDLLLEAMQIGARHFLVKASIGADLTDVLRRLMPTGRTRTGGHGSLITVFSAGGGCGVTTLAINLANELGLEVSSPALVVDMDCAYGAVGSCLGLSGQYGLTDVLDHHGQIDEELVISTALVYSPSLHVLLSPASVNYSDPAPLHYDRLESALEAFRSAYYHTVIDAARVGMDVAAGLASASDATLLVFQLNVKELTTTRALLEALTRRGVPAESIMPVANRYRRRGRTIEMAEAQNALGRPITPICSDFFTALRSINYGQPLAQTAPRSPLRRELQGLASRLVNSHAKGARANRP